MTYINRSNFQAHPFHLVSPSPWPIFTSINLLTLTTSGVLTMHGFAIISNFFFVILMTLVFSMFLWFRDIIAEATYKGDHTLAVQKGLNMGVALFIISEALFFLAIFWTFFHSALSPNVEIGAQWPPMGIAPINPFELPLLNTVILLSSGVTVTYAHHSIIQGNRSGSLYGLLYTIILAVIFTSLQAVEYVVSSYTISDGIYGSCFYFGTGLIFIAPLNKRIIPMSFFSQMRLHSLNTSAKSISYSNFSKEYWITGFSDAESSFSIRVSKDSSRLLGIRIAPIYSIELHVKDIDTLMYIKSHFKVGSICTRIRNKRSTAIYAVQSIKDLIEIIIPHFNKYPLLSQKRADFILFSQAVSLLYNRLHLTENGIYEILSLKASMGKGLSTALVGLFPNITPTTRPIVTDQNISSISWLVGFVDGEGCFYIKATKSRKVSINFSVSQHIRDINLMNSIKEYLGCGVIETPITRNAAAIVVYDISSIRNIIIPIFLKHTLLTKKTINLDAFVKVSEIIANGEHLTEKGYQKVLNIKSSRNLLR